MKCPHCCSPMLVVDESANPKSQVTFYRCSICSGRHVSSQPVTEALLAEQRGSASPTAALGAIPSMA